MGKKIDEIGTSPYYDTINGTACPMEWAELVAIIKENPHATDPDEQAIYDADGDSWSIRELCAWIGVKMETMEESDNFNLIACPHCNKSFDKIDIGDVQCPHCGGIVGC